MNADVTRLNGTRPADVLSVTDLDDGRVAILFACGLLHRMDRADAWAAATDLAKAADLLAFVKRQRTALTRAVNSGDRDKVVVACAKVVAEWGQPPFNGAWPDDWSAWQRALDDVLPLYQHVDIHDLRPGPDPL